MGWNVGRRAFMRAILMMPLAGAHAAPIPRVLFICQYGTAKSAIAREFFRRRARERGIAVSAFSRGLSLEDHISQPLSEKLQAEGIDPSHDHPQILAKRDLRRADIVVMFNPLPVSLGLVTARDWTTLPSVNDNWPAARAHLVVRIDALLDEIAGARR
jgi:arsenate reductase (thioredoxin)